MKEAIRSLAQKEQISESALLKQLLSAVLRMSESSASPEAKLPSQPTRDSRISVRLSQEDQQLLAERSAGRGMPCATCISVLVRTHLRKVTPMPKEELLALKRVTSELGAIGRNVNQIARAANQSGGTMTPDAHLALTLRVLTALRDHIKALLIANQKSWEEAMPHFRSEPGRATPLLDIASYARRGPGKAGTLLPSEIETIARTVRRTPEVMVKVLSHGGQDLGAVTRHFDYLNRKGEFDIETDDRQHLTGKNSGNLLAEDWDLDLEVHRRSANLEAQAVGQE
jgi:Bacterial mobilisation protein (MobC)